MEKSGFSKLKSWLAQYSIARGIYFSALWIAHLPGFIKDYAAFRSMARGRRRFTMKATDIFPKLLDDTGSTGFDPHYVYHPAWAARIIAERKPAKHVDISSFLQFSTLVSAFIPVEFYDYRPADVRLPGLTSRRGDLMSLPFPDDSVESISCMHTVEHVGLGRYGDRIDPDGDVKAARELARVVKPGGTLIFVTPVGQPKICFNAHRIYSYEQVLGMFGGLELREFSMVPDDFRRYGLIKDADPAMIKDQSYACGCFWFTKR
ncbi:MAG: DUF268 domain-containing protein [Patescibacteria group bacterium]|nr:DUF268 domain-containing protein [Patescibacteria group bacterium]